MFNSYFIALKLSILSISSFVTRLADSFIDLKLTKKNWISFSISYISFLFYYIILVKTLLICITNGKLCLMF